eukprot:17095-Heterococcus_DN1.PRE.4
MFSVIVPHTKAVATLHLESLCALRTSVICNADRAVLSEQKHNRYCKHSTITARLRAYTLIVERVDKLRLQAFSQTLVSV